ncbi:MAG TPA: M20/M25/M40 family metallo-hydrolase [Candidatus Polarisedimenticolaceae bacterium]|nr:M20/M25/M40 family metallo-hydrolase [Candidatus Polarisedimenticolaceae bacterium]
MRRFLFVLAALLAMRAPAASRSATKTWISVFPDGSEAVLREAGVEIWTREPGFVIGGADEDTILALTEKGIEPIAALEDDGSWMYLLHHRAGFAAPSLSSARVLSLSPEADLYLFDKGLPVSLPRLKPYAAFQGVPRLPLPPIEPHPADLAPASGAKLAVNPLVQQIVDATSQAAWFQYVKDLSGENPVVIGGQSWTISTRYSASMFPTPAVNAHATEYLEDKGAGWGYSSVRETYTSTDSGCGGAQTGPWQNLIFVVPGQVDYGKHQQVLFVNHYDTISFTTLESQTYAPGADDAMSGGAALLEAMRTFKDYAFKNTIVFGWFTGEEVGICGSTAYSRQHPSVDMWRVVNMDQTAFDGDLNRLMDVYNWDTTNSPASVALGDAFVQANADYGNIIDPAKIVRDTSKMCQTDHCPFWSVGVAAIAVTEDLHNNDICPCFDQGQSSTCHDTVTQMFNGRLMFTQDYSWPSEKAAIATIASLAEPLYACPASAVAAPTLTPKNNAVSLSWDAASGVTRYVVERAPTVAGPFAGIASVTGTSYEDTSVVNGSSWAYRIRTCPSQVSASVTGGPAAGADVVYQDGSASIARDGSDEDGIADDCELVKVDLRLVNDGNVPLTGVRLVSVVPTSAAVRVASALPQLAGDLAVGATVTVSFKAYVGRDGVSAACGDPLTFAVTAVSDQSAPTTRSFTLTAERSTVAGPLSYGFESDFSGWTVAAGSITRVAGGAPGSIAFSLHTRNQGNDCNAVQSPLIKPGAGSTMTMYVDYGIESGSFDRANVRVVDTATGVKTLLTPTGATYNTNGNSRLLCDGIGNTRGWSGSFTTWRQATFDLSAFAGREIRLDARYSTDSSVLGSQGFWMDAVQIANATQINCDAQSNVCAALPAEVSPDGDPVPFTIGKSGTDLALGFSQSLAATSYEVYAGTLANLRSGIYDHAAIGLCAIPDADTGDGIVSLTVPAASIADDAYLLAVAKGSAGESPYGHASGPVEIPLALNACP